MFLFGYFRVKNDCQILESLLILKNRVEIDAPGYILSKSMVFDRNITLTCD